MSGPTDPATVLSVPLKQSVQRKEDGFYVTARLDIEFAQDTLNKAVSDLSDHMKWIAAQYPQHVPHDAAITTSKLEDGSNLLTLEGSMMLKPIVVK